MGERARCCVWVEVFAFSRFLVGQRQAPDELPRDGG